MSKTLEIEIPIVSGTVGEVFLARPLGFPDITIASSRMMSGVEKARRQVVKRIRDFVATELVPGLVLGEVRHEQLAIEFTPPTRDLGWREPLVQVFDVLRWEIRSSLCVAVIPVLGLRVVASPHTDFEKLIAEQVKAAIRRQDDWSLAGLKSHEVFQWDQVHQGRRKISIDTPLEHQRRESSPKNSATPTLKALATRLKPGTVGPTVGREEEIQRLDEILGQGAAEKRARRSALLVGPLGVGKTAIFHGWVNRQAESGKNLPIWSTDGSRLISGQSGFGGWQQQCLEMIEEARKTSAIVYLGNATELCESGKMQGGSLGSGGCGALLVPRIADSSLTAVMECTFEQYEHLSRTEPRLIESLTRMEVAPANAAQTREILLEAAQAWKPVDISAQIRRKRKRKSKRQVSRTKAKKTPSLKPQVSSDAFEQIDRLHQRFPTELASPGRSLVFFESVMSELHARDQAQRKRHVDQPVAVLNTPFVMDSFSRQTGLPAFLIDPAVRPDLDKISNDLNSQVLGQPHVVEVLTDLIAVLATDLSRGDRPLASLLMIGPTGVGKTETAKAMARLIYGEVSRLVRIDMSQYGDPYAGDRLIRGMDGGDSGGVLTAAVQAQPFSLILLDEFEKADPSVFDLLLQVMGEGRLTDRNGRVADFRNTIIMMTSNLGVEDIKETQLGLAANAVSSFDSQGTLQQQTQYFHRKVREFLRPEMYNRLDRILAFEPLSSATIHRLAKRQIESLARRDGLRQRNIDLFVDDDVVARIADAGYQPQYGARPLAREIERHLLTPLATRLAKDGDVAKSIHVREADSKIRFSVVRQDAKGSGPEVETSNSSHDQVELPESMAPVNWGPANWGPVNWEPVNWGKEIQRVTLLRRRGQSLVDGSAYRDLRISHTRLDRKLQRKIAANKKNLRAVGKLRAGPLAQQCQMMLDKLELGERLVAQTRHLEQELLSAFHTQQPIDQDMLHEQTGGLEKSVYDLLCDLVHPHLANRNQTVLALTGKGLSLGTRLADAYRSWAAEKGISLVVYAVLLRDLKGRRDFEVEQQGWDRKPAFAIPTQSESLAMQRGERDQAGREPFASLAAYRMKDPQSLAASPEGTLGWLMGFDGPMAALLLAGEVGVHSFHLSEGQDRKKTSVAESWMVAQFDQKVADYVAPDCLAKANYQCDGLPKRKYDLVHGFVEDLSQFDSGTRAASSQPRRSKFDRGGKWLGPLIEWNQEMRTWAMLDESWPKESSETLPPG